MCELHSSINLSKEEAFAGQLLNMFNLGGVNLMVSIGHRTGLFDTLGDMPPAGSEEIARQAGLHERYVREWLNAMVAGQTITEYQKNGISQDLKRIWSNVVATAKI